MTRAAARRRRAATQRTWGRRRDVPVASRGLHAEVPVALWSPAGARAHHPLGLLLVHDGPDYARHTALLRREHARRFRAALLSAPERDEWYSASATYARALAGEVIPAVERTVSVAGRPVAIGASLGALALLQAHRRHPDAFAGLLLQSGSYFVPRFDRHESGFERYGRIVRFVRTTLRASEHARPVPVTITCGADEENLANNRLMADALAAQGYDVRFAEVPGGHDWPAWDAGLCEHLDDLLARAWG